MKQARKETPRGVPSIFVTMEREAHPLSCRARRWPTARPTGASIHTPAGVAPAPARQLLPGGTQRTGTQHHARRGRTPVVPRQTGMVPPTALPARPSNASTATVAAVARPCVPPLARSPPGAGVYGRAGKVSTAALVSQRGVSSCSSITACASAGARPTASLNGRRPNARSEAEHRAEAARPREQPTSTHGSSTSSSTSRPSDQRRSPLPSDLLLPGRGWLRARDAASTAFSEQDVRRIIPAFAEDPVGLVPVVHRRKSRSGTGPARRALSRPSDTTDPRFQAVPAWPAALNAPGRNRTCDLALRRRALYPLSYGRLGSGQCSAAAARSRSFGR